MNRCLFALLTSVLTLGVMTSVCAQTASSQAAVSISTSGEFWVGQKVTLVIDLLAPGYFSGVPRFDFPQIPGVLLVPPEAHPVLSTKQIDGQSFTDQRYEVALFAKKPGAHEVPAFKIRFELKRLPLDPEAVAQEVETAAINFTAKLPPGAEDLRSLISADDLVVESKWNPEPHACKVGDAFTRTITYSATDVPGMAFPPFPAPPVEGLNVYASAPVIADQSERGTLRGTRTDTITYVCKKAGTCVVPAVQITWWNLKSQALQTIKFPSQTFEVASNPGLVNQAQPTKAPLARYLEWIAVAVSLMAGLIIILRNIPWKILSQALGFLRPVHLKRLNP